MTYYELLQLLPGSAAPFTNAPALTFAWAGIRLGQALRPDGVSHFRRHACMVCRYHVLYHRVRGTIAVEFY